MRGEAVTTGRWLRFVLLACTLSGFAAMHSLGHDPVLGLAGHGGHAGPISSADVDDGCHDERCVAPAAQITEEPGHGHPSGWAVCLAVATGLALATVFAARHLRRTRSVRTPDRQLTRARGGRAPPAFPMIGLTTASASVLRI
ncbi:hypothetical protein [Micromonospora palythoicola]|uniref:hypothetical protein n=1 Tax=Micromonospora palythoicola TaxID=3120507 RepID=UPI002FCDF7FE